MITADPAAMTEVERLAEIAEILARGIQRFFAARCKAQITPSNSQVDLDVLGRVEAPCGSRVQNPQSRKPA